MSPVPPASPSPERLGVVVAGHVDHGKSTVVGHLLVASGALPQGRLEQIRAECQRTGRPFEYAFLLDALKDERAQNITLDSARVFFRSPRREYVVIDAPGHVEFLKNMVSGASRADAALLVVDAKEGVQENSRRHGALLAMLGLTQVVVLVNKMDAVGRDERVFRRLEAELVGFLAQVGLSPRAVVPVSGREGDHLVTRSTAMPWYDGPTVLEALDAFRLPPRPVDASFRLWVQDVYRFTTHGDARRIVAGTVDSGALSAGDELTFYPSGKRARVQALEAFPGPSPLRAEAGDATGFSLAQQVYVQRGELATRADEAPPKVTSRVRATVLWLGRRPLDGSRPLHLKLGTSRVPVRLERVHRVMDAGDLSLAERPEVRRHEVAECTLALERAIAFDVDPSLPDTARFVLVEDFEVCGGGLVREALDDALAAAREAAWRRNQRWEPGAVPPEARAARLGQRPTLLLITGPNPHDRKGLARALEARLFAEGHGAYFLGIGNVLHGVDADLSREPSHRVEHLRRLAEVAHLFLDAGQVLLATAAELSADEVALVRTAVAPHPVEVAWLGERGATDLVEGATLSPEAPRDALVEALWTRLAESGALVPVTPSETPAAAVVWLTGLPGSGKSTVAKGVVEALRQRGRRVEHLDGDAIRGVLPSTGFTREERDAHVRRVGFVASRLEAHGVTVVASLVSPYADSRAFVRSLCRRFIEVHVATPLEVCERRDPKGLYAKARAGQLPNFTGVNDPYEAPTAAELTLQTMGAVEDAVAEVLARLDGTGRAR